MAKRFMETIKEYGGTSFIIFAAIISAAIAYGSSQAAISIRLAGIDTALASEDIRINKNQDRLNGYGESIAAIKTDVEDTKREVHQLWLDNGHKKD